RTRYEIASPDSRITNRQCTLEGLKADQRLRRQRGGGFGQQCKETKAAQNFQMASGNNFQMRSNAPARTKPFRWLIQKLGIGWGGRDRTSEWRNQNPLPYRLATPQQAFGNGGRIPRIPHQYRRSIGGAPPFQRGPLISTL